MDKTQFADAIRSVGTEFTKLSVVEDIDSHGYMTEVETSAGNFYASMQGNKDLVESVTAAGTVYTGRSYLYVSELEIALNEGDRFSDSNGSVWVAKSMVDDYRKIAGYSKWIVERVIL